MATSYYREASLTAVKAGITRLRIKGGANPDTLFDLLNGYVTASRSCKIRPGAVIDGVFSTSNSRGLLAYNDKLQVFAHTTIAVPSSKYNLNVLRHPNNSALTLKKIHFATVYVGAIYVVAEFSNGEVFHYWLEEPTTWEANKIYKNEALVQPTTPNGFVYRASRNGNAYPAWVARAPRAVGDKIEPSTYTGFYYEVTSVSGTNPSSGTVEPTWPKNDGETVIEQADSSGTTATIPPEPGAPPVAGGGDDPDYCVVEDTWLSPNVQAMDAFDGMLGDLWTPERGHYRGELRKRGERRLERCVRIVTASTAYMECSRSTPFNFHAAPSDLEDGYWARAEDLLGKTIMVEWEPEEVIAVLDIGWKWVIPMDWHGASFAGTGLRNGRRLYSHNMAKHVP